MGSVTLALLTERGYRNVRAFASARSAGKRLGVTWSARDDLGKVSLIEAGMKSHPGIAAKTFATLDAEGIPVQVVTTSPIKIACHVPSELVGRAVRALHEAFELETVVD